MIRSTTNQPRKLGCSLNDLLFEHRIPWTCLCELLSSPSSIQCHWHHQRHPQHMPSCITTQQLNAFFLRLRRCIASVVFTFPRIPSKLMATSARSVFRTNMRSSTLSRDYSKSALSMTLSSGHPPILETATPFEVCPLAAEMRGASFYGSMPGSSSCP